MGLDMYLERDVYVGGQYEHRDVKGTVDIETCGDKISVDVKRVTGITLHEGYWRKANHIHKWFVDNVQGGVDECQRAYVDTDKLKELQNICYEVLSAKDTPDGAKIAGEKLPTQEGFFFGPTEYDEYYYGDIVDTIRIIETALSNGPEGKFYYQSSW